MKLSIAFGLLVANGGLCVAGPKSFVMKNAEPVIAGSRVLPPGEHVWKLMDSASNRHIVTISNQKTGAVETTILAVPNYRETPSNKNSVQFWETPKGYPQAVRSWFYPGDKVGQEFPYPKQLLAAYHPPPRPRQRRTHSTLVVAGPEPAAPMTAPSVVVARASAVAAPQPQPALRASAGSWAVIGEGPGFWDTLRKLPKTATLAPLALLIGLVSLGFWLFGYLRRNKRKLYTVGDDSP